MLDRVKDILLFWFQTPQVVQPDSLDFHCSGQPPPLHPPVGKTKYVRDRKTKSAGCQQNHFR